MRRLYKDRGFSEKATSIILQSWRQSSQKQYDGHVRKWARFCSQRQVDPIHPTVGVAVEFLTMLYENGLRYISINSARSALSAILDKPDCLHPTFGRLVKVASLPRYSKKWDVNLVWFHEWLPRSLVKRFDIKASRASSAQRSQSINFLDTMGMVREETRYTFLLNSHIKQSKPGKTSSELFVKFSAYPHDRKLSVVSTCSVYLDRTQTLRGNETRLFITHQKPHKKASRNTIRSCIREIMAKAGVYTSTYKPYSVRLIATSKAKVNNASLQDIMKTAG